jgi:very-short-patch-repair endonuclease
MSGTTGAGNDGERAARSEGRTDARIDTLLARLLDLSLRNRLLNFRPTKQSMQAASAGLAQACAIEDAVAKDGKWFRLQATDFPDDLARQLDHATADLQRGVLRMRAPADRCAADSIEIFRRAHRTLDETGANPLYLVVGTLEHRDPETGQSGRAPLLLVPLEIERLSRTEGCRVRRAEADITLNAALAEFLRQRHRLELGIDELAEDESGIDVKAILEGIRARIASMPGWAVHEDVHVACLDFRKWPIWTDIRQRREAVRAHPIVGTVLGRSGAGTAMEPIALEAKDPAELALPLPCDGSQLAAVLAAGARRTFVLQGPPGTGKSQTITNLVSHAVTGGMRVLFVAEKQVALDVVARRLAESGLGPWMLNLHPEKCGRAEFVAQVKEAMERLDAAPKSAAAPAASGDRARLAALRDATATVRACGFSAYGAAERLCELGEGAGEGGSAGGAAAGEGASDAIDLRATVNALLTRAQFDAMLAAAGRLAEAATRAMAGTGGSLDAHPLHDLQGDGEPARIAATAAAVRAARSSGAPDATVLRAAAGGEAWNADVARVRAAITAIARDERARAAFAADARFDVSVLEVDSQPLLADLRTRGARFWPFGWLARRAIARALARHSSKAVPSDRASLESALALIAESRTARDGESQARPMVSALLGERAATASAAGAMIDALVAMDAAIAGGSAAKSTVAGAPHGTAAHPAPSQPLAAWLPEALQAIQPIMTQRPALAELAERAKRWSSALPLVDAWHAWLHAARSAREVGLAPLVDAVASARVAPDECAAAAERAMLRAWLSSLRDNMEQFRSFDPVVAERMAESYARALDASRAAVGKRAAAAVKQRFLQLDAERGGPASEQLARLAELRALQRPRRSIRTLIRQTGAALAAVKPVVLASPLSAAMHLDPALPPFDLVVFDEASQVPLADALGALSRGTAAVVVGDSKQLPPTSFFDGASGGDDPDAGSAAGSDAEDDPGFEELESVLDEFVASRFPELMLRWHYRSRDERLIAFSNANIYGGRLQTFPGTFRAHPRLGVSLRHVAGTYDRSKTRTNPEEAKAVVAELADRLRSSEDVPANRSLGVVAFSLAQQTLIQDLFDELVDGDAAVRATLAGLPEPILIKNLEAVQGDERATMLFSIGYGRDADGRMAMNFGPMNRAGGERRLNVAITRAREQMVVFSTIRAGDIDLSRSGASGVRLLRDFLEFAERGTAANAPADPLDAASQHAGHPDAVEESIARALERRGWTVDRHVGSSSYRVSLALRDRVHPDRWCLGIELDGPFWQSGATVADREILRRDVLRRLGWRTMRVWSAEWLKDPAKVVAAIEAAAGA